MQKEFGGIMVSALESQQDAMALVEKLFEVAQPSATYGEPVTAGDYTVITASEVKVGLGYGFGGGAGIGGGGGGGGVSGSRPVAAISIGPEGVSVQPVVDVTKIALALFTTIGAMFVTLNRMKRAGRTLAGD
jgi:uncharacterized spore protein YtfJ